MAGCWLKRDQDAWLAVAGVDGCIRILSVVYSKEILQLTGHTGKDREEWISWLSV